jgi:hypothetical protein
MVKGQVSSKLSLIGWLSGECAGYRLLLMEPPFCAEGLEIG